MMSNPQMFPAVPSVPSIPTVHQTSPMVHPPKRSNSGREIPRQASEIMYIQNQRLVGSNQPAHDVIPSQQPPQHQQVFSQREIPADVKDVFDSIFKKYAFRDLYHWLKIDRAHEINRYSSQFGPHELAIHSRPPLASSARSSRTSSVFSMPNGLDRNSFASSRTSWSVISENGLDHNNLSPHDLHLAQAMGLDSSVGMLSPQNRASLRASTLPAVKGAARQRETDLETKKRYFCTACNKGFARKYDWKVHEQRYHEQQFQYPCPDCNQILYAETHFRSHHRDAHGCQQCTHAKEVSREVDARARRTAWGCGFCASLLEDWEKRCDHISSHYDDGMRRAEWDHTKVIIGLLKQPEIDESWRALLISKHGQMPNPPLNIKFSRDLTGRSHGDSLGLQDLLELGAIDRNLDAIVMLAYEQGVLHSHGSPTETNKQLESVAEEQESSSVSPPNDSNQDSIMASPTMEPAVLPSQQSAPTNSTFFANAPLDFTSQGAMMEMSQSPMPMDGGHVQSMFTFGNMNFPEMYPSAMFNNQRSSVQSMTDKALPPLPQDASDVNMMQTPSLHDMTDGPFELDNAWPLMGATSFGEEGGAVINLGTYDPKNQI